MIKKVSNTLTNPKARMTQLEAQIDGLAKHWQSRIDALLEMIKEVDAHSKSVRIDATRNFNDVIDRVEALEKKDVDISGLVARMQNVEITNSQSRERVEALEKSHTQTIEAFNAELNHERSRIYDYERVKPHGFDGPPERTLMDRQADQIIALQQELKIAREQTKAFKQIALDMASKFPKPAKVASILKGEYVPQAPSHIALVNEIEFLLPKVTDNNLKHVVAYVQSHKQTVFEVLLFALLLERDRKIVITPEFMDFAKRAKPYFMEMVK